MLNQLIDSALRNRLSVIMLTIATLIGAIIYLPKLNLDAFPDVTSVQVEINTEAPGLAAEEVEQLITYPIEAVMYSLPDVVQVRSVSKTGLSGVSVVFKDTTDIYFARQLVFEKLQAARELIPTGVGIPEIGPNTSGLGQIYQYLLISDDTTKFDSVALRSLNDWLVKLLIMPIDGVTDVLSFGGEVRQYQVNVDPSKLLAYGLTQQDVVQALQNNNANVGGWYLNRGQEQLVIRAMGWFESDNAGVQNIQQVPVKTDDGVVITVSDIAQVALGSEMRQGAVTMTRKNAAGHVEALGEVVTGIVLKRVGANTKQTIDGLNARIAMINNALPNGVRFEPFYDQSTLIAQSVITVAKALVLAFVFIVVVLALFLMDLRAIFLVLISIPLSIGMALTFMAWWGISANLMSLGGIAVAIGMLVDGSVVMVENIYKHLQQRENKATNAKQTKALIKTASIEVARPVFFASMIILIVFAPLFSFEGVEAKLFQPMAISIILAVISALCTALFIVPVIATYLFNTNIRMRRSSILFPIEHLYRRLLRVCLANVKKVVTLALLCVFIALSALPKIGTEFAPELEEGTINLRVTLAPSSSLDTALYVADKLEQKLMAFPEVTYALSKIGRAEVGGDPEPVNNIEIYIGLTPISTWKGATSRFELQQKMANTLSEFPGLLLTFSQPIATRVDELLSGVKAQLAIKLFGPDLAILANKGRELEKLVKSVNGTRDVALEQINGEAQLVITPNRQALSRYGLSVNDVMAVVQHGVGGVTAGQIIKGNERYDIYVRFAEPFRNSSEAIADIRIQSPTGAWVRIGDIATVTYDMGPPQVRRDDVQRRVVVQANVQGRDMGSVVAEINTQVSSRLALPAGYSVTIGGQFESQQRAQKRLLFVVPVSIALIALLLYFAFGSIGQTLLILLNVPLAVVGGVLSLYLSGQHLSVPSSVGFITLFGVAVLNGVVMVSSINQRMRRGENTQSAVFEGASSRLRPVLITALTSALSLVPMLLSNGVGAEIQRPLASVIVGGLVSATLFTLLVLPTLYGYFSKNKLKNQTV